MTDTPAPNRRPRSAPQTPSARRAPPGSAAPAGALLRLLWVGIAAALPLAGSAVAGDGGLGPEGAGGARFAVTERAVAPPAAPISATVERSLFNGGSLVGSGFEPRSLRLWIQAAEDAPADRPGRLLAPSSALSFWTSLREGALDGAEVQVLRVVDGALREVRRGVVPPGGHALAQWAALVPEGEVVAAAAGRASERVSPPARPGVPRWYALRAVDARGRLSPLSEPVRVDLPAELENGTGGEDDRRVALAHDRGAASGAASAAAGGPTAPRIVRAGMAGGAVRVEWDPARLDGDVAGLVLYRSHHPPLAHRGVHLDIAPLPGAPDPDSDPQARLRAGDLAVVRKRVLDLDRRRLAADRVWDAGTLRALRPGPLDWPDAGAGGGTGAGHDPTWRLRPHEGVDDLGGPGLAAGGRTYAEFQIEGRAEVRIGSHRYAGTGQAWYPVLEPGVPYRVSARIRGARPGRALFRLGGPLEGEMRPLLLDYGTEWTRVEAEFTVPRVVTGAAPGRMDLILQGPGRVDVDDLRVHRADVPWQGLAPRDRARLAEADLSALRYHQFIKTGFATYDAGGLLNGGATAGGHDLRHALAATLEAGADPWLQIEPHFDDGEWLAVVEWLAAPAPPAGREAGRPWAALRAAQGRTAPWTDAFDRIYLEIGNEMWNRLFEPWITRPMPDGAGGQASSGAVYGLLQERVAAIMRTSPWWTPELEDKVVWVVGGWSGFDFGVQAARAAPTASELVAIAAYNGGWDEGEGPAGRDPQTLFNVLNQVEQTIAPIARRHAEEVGRVAADQRRPIAAGTYEAGPGYALDGLNGARVSAEAAAAQEAVMKGAGAGAATLDSFLVQHAAGFGMQNYFTFGEGWYWKSHRFWHEGGGPYPAWAWVTLLNRLGWGEALAVDTLAVPRADLPAGENRRRLPVADAPLVALHALRAPAAGEDGGGRLVLAAVSRRAPGHDDGNDGSGGNGEGGTAPGNCTPVAVALPPAARPARVREMRVWRWEEEGGGDVRATELDPALALRVPENGPGGGVLRIGADTGGAACGLPAAGALVYELVLAPDPS